MRLVTCIFILAVTASCPVRSTPSDVPDRTRPRTADRQCTSAKQNKTSPETNQKTSTVKSAPEKRKKPSQSDPRKQKDVSGEDVITVFLTGYELGEMKPCGCSGGQLGGLDRRPAIFNTAPKERTLLIDTGSFVRKDDRQDLLKFDIIIQALNIIGYDVVNLAEKDVQIAGNLGSLQSISSLLNTISPLASVDPNLPAKFTKKFSLEQKTVAITVAAFDAKSAPKESLCRLLPRPAGMQTVNILIVNHCDPAFLDYIAGMTSFVDCLVCPSEFDEPELVSEPNRTPLVFSVGQFGRYVTKLRINTARDKPTLSYSKVPVTEDLKPHQSLVELYKTYQNLVRQYNLLEIYPRFILPAGLRYVGSEACKTCHEYEYEKWSTKPHAEAYATLERVGNELDPECVICHVIGMEYESGFILPQQTPHLKNVGCEVCHGPGSEHIKSLGVEQCAEPRWDCIRCHTPDHSGEYAGNEDIYFQKIIHWKEQNSPEDVK